MPDTHLDSIVEAAWDEQAEHTPDALRHVLWYAQLGLHDSSGRVMVEIGVREGHTSYALTLLAAMHVAQPTIVLGIDPWGNAPYSMWDTVAVVSVYGAEMYCAAKQRLAPVACHYLLPVPAEQALRLLPEFVWFTQGQQYALAEQGIAFAFLDGQHTNQAVSGELSGLWPLLAPGGVIMVDDADCACAAIEMWVAGGEGTVLLNESQQTYYPPCRPKRAVFQKPREGMAADAL